MQFKPPIQQSPSNNQLLRLSPLSRSLLIPIINKQIPPKKAHFQNGYATQKFFNRYARTQYILAGSLIVSLAMIIIYFELSIDNDPLTQSVLYLSSVFQFFCIFVLVINHITFNDYKMHQKHHFQTKKYSELIFYALFLLVKPYPFLEQYSISFENQLIFQTHQINHLLCLVSFLQVFLVIPCFFVRSKYQSLRSQRISDMYGSRASYVYALKCWFKENSVFEILMVFFCWFGFCVFGIRISEYQTNHSLQSFQNSVWLTFITMSTVGFGDLTPKSNVGYTISTITMYSGVMVMSIVVMILRESFSLSSRQKRTLKILRTLQQKSQLKILASKFIRSALWRIWKNKQNRHFGTFFSPDMEQRNARQQFRLLRRISQKNNFQNNLKDQFQHNFAKIYGYLDSLEQNQSRIINALQNLR